MARALIGAAMLVGLLSHTATAHADPEPSEDVVREAERASVDPVALQGALNSEHDAGNDVEACTYLRLNAEVEGCIGTALMITKPEPPPVSVSLAARVACIEAKESGGANVWNRSGSSAGGVMQYMAPTFRAHAAEMGHPEWSLWNPAQARAVAAHDLALGRRAQWSVGGCP